MPARGLGILLLCSVSSSAQTVFVPIEGARAAAAENVFERASTVPALKCSLRPSTPVLTFGLQYEAGYTMDFSIEQASWPPHELDIYFCASNSIKQMKNRCTWEVATFLLRNSSRRRQRHSRRGFSCL